MLDHKKLSRIKELIDQKEAVEGELTTAPRRLPLLERSADVRQKKRAEPKPRPNCRPRLNRWYVEERLRR